MNLSMFLPRTLLMVSVLCTTLSSKLIFAQVEPTFEVKYLTCSFASDGKVSSLFARMNGTNDGTEIRIDYGKFQSNELQSVRGVVALAGDCLSEIFEGTYGSLSSTSNFVNWGVIFDLKPKAKSEVDFSGKCLFGERIDGGKLAFFVFRNLSEGKRKVSNQNLRFRLEYKQEQLSSYQLDFHESSANMGVWKKASTYPELERGFAVISKSTKFAASCCNKDLSKQVNCLLQSR